MGSSRDVEKLIKQVRRRIDRLVEMYAESYIEKEGFQREVEVARKRLSVLEAELTGAQRPSGTDSESVTCVSRVPRVPFFRK